MDWKIETVKTDSSSIDCLRFGHGSETLAILPGASVLSVMNAARDIVDAYAPLAGSFDICLLDYRRDFPDPYPVCDMAQDAYEAIKALGFSRTCLFGASLGGMVALSLAAEHPDFAQKLVLGSTAARVPEGRRRLFAHWAVLAEAGDARELCLSFEEAIYPPSVFDQVRGQLDKVAEAATTGDLDRFRIMMRSIMAFDVTDQMHKIICPVLAIGSHDDRVLGPEGTLQIAKRLEGQPSFEMHLYNGYGHASYDIAPDYKDRMLQFLVR